MEYANHTLWSKFTPIVCNTVHAMQLVSFHINMSKSLGTWIGQGTWDCGQWTLYRWTAPSQWNYLSSAVICKSRSFASQVENWVNAMLGGIATESEMETEKAVPWAPDRLHGNPFGEWIRDGGSWMAMVTLSLQCFCLAASTKYKRQQNSKRHTRARTQKSGQNMTHRIPAIHALHSKNIPITGD